MKLHLLLSATLLACSLSTAPALQKHLVIIAGKPSHPPGMHEFRAGALLLQQCLAGVPQLSTTIYTNGWPGSDSLLDKVDAIVIYADGGPGHPAIQGGHLDLLQSLIDKGVGFGVMHYG